MKSVRTIAICRNRQNTDWYATALFDDGLVYNCALDMTAATSVPAEFNSWAYRAAYHAGIDQSFGCLVYLTTNYAFVAKGSYRLEIDRSGPEGHVPATLAESGQFDDNAKARIKVANAATKDAVRRHKAYVPAAQSWGTKPCVYLPEPTAAYPQKPCWRRQRATKIDLELATFA